MNDTTLKLEKDEIYKDMRQNTATPEQERRLEELSCIEMINSILAYGGTRETATETLAQEENRSKSYLKPYIQELGRERVLQLIEEQLASIFKIESNIYTDSDGCSYNSIVWKNKEEVNNIKIIKAEPAGWRVETPEQTFYFGEYGQFGCNCNDGVVYKDEKAFETGEGVCYINEYGFDNNEQNAGELFNFGSKESVASEIVNNPYTATDGYTRSDFIDICDGDETKARDLFNHVDWQTVETLAGEGGNDDSGDNEDEDGEDDDVWPTSHRAAWHSWENSWGTVKLGTRIEAFRMNQLCYTREKEVEEYEDNYDIYSYQFSDLYSTYLAIYDGKLTWTINKHSSEDGWDSVASYAFVDNFPEKKNYGLKELRQCAREIVKDYLDEKEVKGEDNVK